MPDKRRNGETGNKGKVSSKLVRGLGRVLSKAGETLDEVANTIETGFEKPGRGDERASDR